MVLLAPTSVFAFLVTIRYSELASFATPITAFGYKPKSFKFHPDGAETDTVLSELETGTFTVAVVVVVVVLAAVVVVWFPKGP